MNQCLVQINHTNQLQRGIQYSSYTPDYSSDGHSGRSAFYHTYCTHSFHYCSPPCMVCRLWRVSYRSQWNKGNDVTTLLLMWKMLCSLQYLPTYYCTLEHNGRKDRIQYKNYYPDIYSIESQDGGRKLQVKRM